MIIYWGPYLGSPYLGFPKSDETLNPRPCHTWHLGEAVSAGEARVQDLDPENRESGFRVYRA